MSRPLINKTSADHAHTHKCIWMDVCVDKEHLSRVASQVPRKQVDVDIRACVDGGVFRCISLYSGAC